MVNEAALLSARKNRRRISMVEMEEAIDRIIAGPERKAGLSVSGRRLVAYHEAGHAVLGHILPYTDPVHKVSIIPRDGRWLHPEPAQGGPLLYDPDGTLDRIIQILGGRVAEELVWMRLAPRPNDLERATEMVRKMIMEYGMSKSWAP